MYVCVCMGFGGKQTDDVAQLAKTQLCLILYRFIAKYHAVIQYSTASQGFIPHVPDIKKQ